MKTKESNRLIAEFMGVKPIKESPDIYTYSDMPWISVREDSPEKVMDAITEYVKYDKEWNWLMPVVERIEAIGFPIDIFVKGVSIHKQDGEPVVDLSGLYAKNKMSTVYDAVVQFILWYNENY